jgi:peptidoglycan/LPS O-acetylase OafA/YrhL
MKLVEDKKIPWITGIKGIAALLVFFHHFFLFFYPVFCNGNSTNKIVNIIIKTPLNIFSYAGNSSVCLFYLISGFLISYTYFYINNKNQKISSIFKRYFQLAIPILLSSIIIYIILKSEIFRTETFVNLYSQNGFNNYYKDFNMNFFNVIKSSFYDIFATGNSVINPPLWTMKNELIFSITTMLILSTFGKNKNRIYIYLFLILFFPDSYLSCFIFGVILLELFVNKNDLLEKINRTDIKIIILLFGLYLSSYTYLSAQSKYYSLLNFDLGNLDKNVVYHGLGTMLIMLFILLSKRTQKILSNKIFIKLGNLSLNIYLFHWIVINTISMYIVYKLLSIFGYFVSVLISFIISTFITIIISKYFDKYIKNITKFFCNKIIKKLN